jgi:hypothetical protein
LARVRVRSESLQRVVFITERNLNENGIISVEKRARLQNTIRSSVSEKNKKIPPGKAVKNFLFTEPFILGSFPVMRPKHPLQPAHYDYTGNISFCQEGEDFPLIWFDKEE